MSSKVSWTVTLGWALSTVVPNVDAHLIAEIPSISVRALVMFRIRNLHIAHFLQTLSPIALAERPQLILYFRNLEKIVQHQFRIVEKSARNSFPVDIFARRYAMMANAGPVWNE
jgi:hypothetical protein